MKCVLVLDDERVIVRMCRRILARLGLTAFSAYTVADALLEIRRRPPDLLVCDIDLPDGSGLDVAREFLKARPGAPVIVMTGSGEPANEEAAAKLGVRAYFNKPFDVDRFTSAVLDALGKC
ncbi:MAG: response regulator [Elusimicrobia bacterium]|nr:response regulator [Elusimicrobiota bacterium]